MPTLHIIDPLLVSRGGHYLSQHVALWNLCQDKGFDMVSYCQTGFDSEQMPAGVRLEKVFGKTSSASLKGHYCIDLASSNMDCYEELKSIDHTVFAADDIVFLTSLTASRSIAYGKWLREIIDELPSRIGLYAITSSEVDDTLGRQMRRNGIEISDASFQQLDEVVVPNEIKRSMFRYLFDSIPADQVDRFRVFYEEPFPNRAFLETCKHDSLKFIYTHSMYSGRPTPQSQPRSEPSENLKIAYLGSGGVGDVSKGQHLIAAVVGEINARSNNVSFIVQMGNAREAGYISEEQKSQLGLLAGHDNLALYTGLLDCETYCDLIESADIVLLPYGPRYRHIMSGIFDECLFLGKVAVIPERCKMSLWMERHNLDCPTFKTWDVEGVCLAVEDAINNITHYQAQFAEAQKIYRQRWERYNPIEAFSH